MRMLAVILLCGLAGCFTERTDFRSGEVACNHATSACPSGMVCAFDERCYRAGEAPSPPDASTCISQTQQMICGARTCGEVFDNCGKKVVCGTCTGTKQCDSTGTCVENCTPLSTCPVGDECGTVDPGCGRSPLSCGGACPSDKPTCVSNKCTCVPLATCPVGVCGSYPNGCGGTLECGDCAGNQTCDTMHCRDKTQAEACNGLTCGTVTTGSTMFTCGSCTSPQVCSIDTGGMCVGCIPGDPCAGRNCGTAIDGCGVEVSCDPDNACHIGLCFECDDGICTFRTQCT